MEMRTAKPYVSTIARMERAEGREEGRHESALRILIHLLEHRFTQIPEMIQQRLGKLSAEQLERLVDTTLSAASLDEFVHALPVKTAGEAVA